MEAVIEVFDPKSQTVLASRELPGPFLPGNSNNIVFRMLSQTDGQKQLAIWRIGLSDRRSKP